MQAGAGGGDWELLRRRRAARGSVRAPQAAHAWFGSVARTVVPLPGSLS